MVTSYFPARPLNVLVEILINGTWQDITDFVQQRQDIQITGGTQDQGTKPSSAQMTLTLNNRDDRFTPNNVSGPYYPSLTASTQIRLSVNDQSVNLTAYNGYRFWGAVTDWPVQSDTSGVDIYVPITAVGPFRYIKQGGGEGSALLRYYNSLTGSFAPVAYWPAEEDNQAGVIGASLQAGQPMTVTGGTPRWRKVSNFNGSAPIGCPNGTTWTGITGSFGSSGNDVFNVPGTYQWIASTTSVTATGLGPGGGSGNGPGDGGGGGGYAQLVLATTIGKQYTITIPAGGQGGDGSGSQANNGAPGAAALVFTGDNGSITCNPGHGGSAYPNASDGAGGTASTTGGTSPVTHTGGAGGRFTPFLPLSGSQAGAGGGSSAGSAANGNAGAGSTFNNPGNGGAAPTGGFAGSNGAAGPTGNPNNGGIGAGAGGGCLNGNTGYGRAGANGGPAQLKLTYTAQTVATTNVCRFILYVPKHGHLNNTVLTRWLTSSTNAARIDCVYQSGGNLVLKVYNNSAVLQFTSSALAIQDNTTLMISIEAVNSGTSIAWTLTGIKPGIGNKKIGTVTNTQTTSSVGNVTTCTVAPNGDVTKACMGHFSVQYALIDLTHVSAALDGHTSEMTVDRFARLMYEEGYNAEMEFNESIDHWGFESGTQSWVGTNATLSSVTSPQVLPGFIVGPGFINNTGDLGQGQVNYWNWPSEGTHSLSIVANGVGAVTARSPSGTSGQPVTPGDTVSAGFDVYTPTAVSGLSCNIDFYNSGGTFLSSSTTALDTPTTAGEVQTVKVTTGTAGAPANAAFFAVSITSSGTLTNGTTFYIDHVRVGPRMGTQTRKRLHDFLEEIRDLEQAILRDSKKLNGLGFRTRIRMISQTPAVTLDWNLAHMADSPAPILDNLTAADDITIKRQRGGKVRVVQPGGPNITGGSGKHRKVLKVAAETDAQIFAHAIHMLTIGTAGIERYPTISVDLTRSEVASLFASVPGVAPGDYVKMINLPAYYPSATAKQLVIGYTETINAYKWTIEWNCTPEAPFEITSTLRRW